MADFQLALTLAEASVMEKFDDAFQNIQFTVDEAFDGIHGDPIRSDATEIYAIPWVLIAAGKPNAHLYKFWTRGRRLQMSGTTLVRFDNNEVGEVVSEVFDWANVMSQLGVHFDSRQNQPPQP